jgi:hypothetical protein
MYLQHFYRSLIKMAAYSEQMFVATKTEDHTVYNLMEVKDAAMLGICKKFAGTWRLGARGPSMYVALG